MTQFASSLLINHLELRVHLGWPDAERQNEQVVFLDVDINFPHPPSACETDNLDDTFCYSALINAIHKKVAEKPFRLIEHLTYELFQLIKPMVPNKANIIVAITKHPDIKGLGSVRFSYQDKI